MNGFFVGESMRKFGCVLGLAAWVSAGALSSGCQEAVVSTVECSEVVAPRAGLLKQVNVGEPVTFHDHIAPLYAQHCWRCHSQCNIAEAYPLVTYEDAKGRGTVTLARLASETARMPPWFAEPGCNEYQDDNHLAGADIQLVKDWVEGGYAEGTEPTKFEDTPERAQFTVEDNTEILEYTIDTSYPAANSAQVQDDYYRCFRLSN